MFRILGAFLVFLIINDFGNFTRVRVTGSKSEASRSSITSASNQTKFFSNYSCLELLTIIDKQRGIKGGKWVVVKYVDDEEGTTYEQENTLKGMGESNEEIKKEDGDTEEDDDNSLELGAEEKVVHNKFICKNDIIRGKVCMWT